MLVTLTFPDELYEEYKKMDPKEPRRVIIKQLTRMQSSSPYQRSLVLEQEQLAELEEMLGDGAASGLALTTAVRNLMTVSVDKAHVSLTTGQLRRLASLATFYKQHPDTYLERFISKSLRETWGA
jgi:hypothetical protein